MKHIVDGLGYQEACNGIKCIDCPFLDNEHNCKIGMYIRSQKVYQERPHGEWKPKQILLGENDAVFMHDGFECKCGRVVTQKENFCPDCGADMRKEGEQND